jgi:hypothetical protein
MANLGVVGGPRCIILAVHRSELDFVHGGMWNRRGREYSRFGRLGCRCIATKTILR